MIRLADLDLTLPFEHPDAHHVYHQYTILTQAREKISNALNKSGIANMIYYPIPLHKQALFGKRYEHLSLPISERVAQHCLSLPIFPEMTESQVKQVAKVIKEALSG